jgi:hypothetical protein
MEKWVDFANQFEYHHNLELVELNNISTPVYCLLPSFYKAIFMASWHYQDACGKKHQMWEVVRLRTLDPIHHHIHANNAL